MTNAAETFSNWDDWFDGFPPMDDHIFPDTETIDPWENRSQNMKCKTCMWFAPKMCADGITNVGRCRRHAPTMSGYPVVYVNDWCGDHKLNENANV